MFFSVWLVKCPGLFGSGRLTRSAGSQSTGPSSVHKVWTTGVETGLMTTPVFTSVVTGGLDFMPVVVPQAVRIISDRLVESLSSLCCLLVSDIVLPLGLQLGGCRSSGRGGLWRS